MIEIQLLDGREILPNYTAVKIVEKLARGEKMLPGSLVAIEAEVELPNVDDALSPENPSSPYAGAIGAGAVLRADGLELIVTDWDAPLATPRSRIRAVDAATHRFETSSASHRLVRGVAFGEGVRRYWRGWGFESVDVAVDLPAVMPWWWATTPQDWDAIAASALVAAAARTTRHVVVFSLSRPLRSYGVVVDTVENAPELHAVISSNVEKVRIEYTDNVGLGDVQQIGKTDIELPPGGSGVVEFRHGPALLSHIAAPAGVEIEIINAYMDKTSAIVYNRTKDVFKGAVEAYGKQINITTGATGDGSNAIKAPFAVGRDAADVLRRNIDGWLSTRNREYTFRAVLDNPLRVGDGVILRSRHVETPAIVVEAENRKAGDGWIVSGRAIVAVRARVMAAILPFFYVEAVV